MIRSGKWRGLVVPVALVVIAEIAARSTEITSDTLAAPSAVIVAGIKAMGDGTILAATGQTLATALGGLGLGLGIGLVFGILLGIFPIADKLMEFSVEAFRPIPSVALLPIAMLVFGFGYRMEISIVAFGTMWPILILTRSAVAGIEPRLLEVSRVLGLGLFARVTKIVLPAALPRIFVAFRLAAGVALIVAVTVEIAANPLGLGYAIMSAQQSLDPALMFALLVWIGLIGWGLNMLLVWAQSRLFGRAAMVEAPQ